MLEFPRWKNILVLVVLFFSLLYALPNLFPQDPAVQITANRGHVVDGALKERVQGVLQKQKLAFKGIEIVGDELLVRLPDPDTQLKASDAIHGELGDDYTSALNLASTVPGWLKAIGGNPLLLGLDLRGGVHFLMEVDQDAVLDKRMNGFVDEIRSLIRDNAIRGADVSRAGNGINVHLANSADATKLGGLIASEMPQLDLKSSSDGATLAATLKPAELKNIDDGAIEQNISTLSNRINQLGVAEPVIQRQGANRIVVELPGVQDTAQAKKVLGATATLEYRGNIEGDAYEAARTGNIPPDAKLYYMRELGPDGKPRPVLLSKRVIVSGDQLESASSMTDSQSGTPAVSVTLNEIGAKRMEDFTTENVGKQMGVVYIERTPVTKIVNGKEVHSVKISEDVINDATIQGVFGKHFQTTGLGSLKEASDLALLLRAGALAAPVNIVEQRVIGPSLGQDNIDAGKRAVIIGFLAVCALMMVYYRLFGVISVLALLSNLLLLTAVLSLMHATMTMPGIAGIVLTLGMAIDGNVLIIERIREELRNGNTPVASIKAGYDRAWAVILDSNVAKLIAGTALLTFGSGPVKGFAVVLLVGVLTSMFTSVTVSRAMATFVYGGGKKIQKVSVGGGF
ncbi:MAG TPA: protein translocase subunit SecD [Xanthomonadaceae bacterium]|jgi:preprotein translocase subunit SecD|nr:protein translocase subunit SecD [Xanthomonadaceae bacterium]